MLNPGKRDQKSWKERKGTEQPRAQPPEAAPTLGQEAQNDSKSAEQYEISQRDHPNKVPGEMENPISADVRREDVHCDLEYARG